MVSLSPSQHKCRFEPDEVSKALRAWYSSDVGNQLFTGIQASLDHILPNLFGFYALQAGCPRPDADLLRTSQIRHHFCMDYLQTGVAVSASSEEMPFDEDSLDLILLTHSLEFSANPHQILREIDRVLIPEGHLIIVGFNPLSLYGLRRYLWPRRSHVPWCGHFYSVNRLKDWLSLLGFDIRACEYSGYRPPIQRSGIQKRLEFMEGLTSKILPFTGGVFTLVAQNKVARVRPIKSRWTPKRGLIPAKIAEPTTRQRHDG